MKWKIASGLLLVLLIATNLWHLYNAVDVGVTKMYRDQECYELANQLKTTGLMCDLAVAGKSESEVVDFLKEHFPGEDPFVKEQGVHITWLSVALDRSGKATECALDDSVAAWATPQGERAE